MVCIGRRQFITLLLGGADVTFECVGRADSLNDAVRLTRARGKLVAVGMPGEERVDWAPIWQRELTVMGAYAYGVEEGEGHDLGEVAAIEGDHAPTTRNARSVAAGMREIARRVRTIASPPEREGPVLPAVKLWHPTLGPCAAARHRSPSGVVPP